MNATRDVLVLLDQVLGLQGRSLSFDDSTPLLGAVPELDSLAVVDLIAALEQRFAFKLHDDEIDGSLFATVGSLARFVEGKCGRAQAA